MSQQFREVIEMIFRAGYAAGVDSARDEEDADVPIADALEGRFAEIDRLEWEAKRLLGEAR